MRYTEVLSLVDQYHTKYTSYTKEVFDDCLPRAVDYTIVIMCRNKDYLKYPNEFMLLGDALNYLNANGKWD